MLVVNSLLSSWATANNVLDALLFLVLTDWQWHFKPGIHALFRCLFRFPCLICSAEVLLVPAFPWVNSPCTV